MTDEEIKQAAANYYEHTITDDEKYKYSCECYCHGAHSRDREVMDLEHLLKAERTTNKVLAEANDKLRNPWISVKERLPEKEIKEGVEQNYSSEVFVKVVDGYKHRYIVAWFNHLAKTWMANFNGISIELKRINIEVTHWMPIPQLKGE